MPLSYEDVREKIKQTLIEYDRKEYKRTKGKPGYYNIYALSHYMRALSETDESIKGGATVAQAIYDNFNDRLLSSIERALKLPVTYGGGGKDKGRPAY